MVVVKDDQIVIDSGRRVMVHFTHPVETMCLCRTQPMGESYVGMRFRMVAGCRSRVTLRESKAAGCTYHL
jgi:hypothetical protein